MQRRERGDDEAVPEESKQRLLGECLHVVGERRRLWQVRDGIAHQLGLGLERGEQDPQRRKETVHRDDDAREPPEKPHYHGHRERLRERLLAGGADALPDYELLEMVLLGAHARRDMKPLAKALLAKFGSFNDVIAAPPARLKETQGVGDSVIAALKMVHAAAGRFARGEVKRRPALSSWSAVLDYCRTAQAFAEVEEFRILFLDKRNHLIADEVQQRGTVDYTPVYPREVVKRALELSATAVVLVHNHPSGDPTPSRADVQMTQQIVDIAKPLGIAVHDHIIVGKDGHASLKGMKLI